MNAPAPWLVKRLLLAPAPVRQAAARRAETHERWLLLQDAAVRRSYVREVLDRGASHELEQAWMLRQPDDVRHSYIAEVLGNP